MDIRKLFASFALQIKPQPTAARAPRMPGATGNVDDIRPKMLIEIIAPFASVALQKSELNRFRNRVINFINRNCRHAAMTSVTRSLKTRSAINFCFD